MAVAGELVVEFRTETASLVTGVERARGEIGLLGTTARQTRQGTKLLEKSLVDMAAGALGLQGPLKKLAEGLGLVVGVGGKLGLILGAFALIGEAIERLTAASRKAAEEQRKHAEAFRATIDAAIAAHRKETGADLFGALEQANQRILQIKAELARGPKILHPFGLFAQVAPGEEERLQGLRQELARLQEGAQQLQRQLDQLARGRAEQQARATEEQVRQAREAAEAMRKAQLEVLEAGLARPDEIQRAIEQEAALRAALGRGNLTMQERAQILDRLLPLEQALARVFSNEGISAITGAAARFAEVAPGNEADLVRRAAEAGPSLAMQGVGGLRSETRRAVEMQQQAAAQIQAFWLAAAEGIADAFGGMFEDIARGANVVTSLLRRVLSAVGAAASSFFGQAVVKALHLPGAARAEAQLAPGDMAALRAPAPAPAPVAAPSPPPASPVQVTVNLQAQALTAQDAQAALLAHGPAIAVAVAREIERSAAIRRAIRGF